MYKLILLLLFIACKVQGQQENIVIKPSGRFVYMDGRLVTKMDTIVYYNADEMKLEIQTLRLLNDSLTKKLQLLLEWQEYACPIIENIGVVKTVNGYRLLVNKREMIKPAVRYYKRYKTN